eukprot:11155642-Lingulodinium_polyedra.AAC.1
MLDKAPLFELSMPTAGGCTARCVLRFHAGECAHHAACHPLRAACGASDPARLAHGTHLPLKEYSVALCL